MKPPSFYLICLFLARLCLDYVSIVRPSLPSSRENTNSLTVRLPHIKHPHHGRYTPCLPLRALQATNFSPRHPPLRTDCIHHHRNRQRSPTWYLRETLHVPPKCFSCHHRSHHRFLLLLHTDPNNKQRTSFHSCVLLIFDPAIGEAVEGGRGGR